MSTERAHDQAGRWDAPAGRSRVAGVRARTWCGAGGFLPTEVMDLAGGVAAGAQTWLRPKEGAGKRTMCFLLGTPRRDFGFCFWCRVIILTCSLTPDKPALVAGWRGRFRRPGRCARARVAWAPHGGRTPQTRRRRPRARQLAGGRDSFPRPVAQVAFLF